MSIVIRVSPSTLFHAASTLFHAQTLASFARKLQRKNRRGNELFQSASFAPKRAQAVLMRKIIAGPFVVSERLGRTWPPSGGRGTDAIVLSVLASNVSMWLARGNVPEVALCEMMGDRFSSRDADALEADAPEADYLTSTCLTAQCCRDLGSSKGQM